jgi:hypothetical protein
VAFLLAVTWRAGLVVAVDAENYLVARVRSGYIDCKTEYFWLYPLAVFKWLFWKCLPLVKLAVSV